MGVVYSAVHADTGRTVALKTVKVPTADGLASIRLEIDTLARIHHPGIVSILDRGVSNAGPWYAMELLEGETLADRNLMIWGRRAPETSTIPAPLEPGAAGGAIMSGARTSAGLAPRVRMPSTSIVAAEHLPAILSIFRRLCVPLAFLHGNGVVHRDLKPANVFLRPDDQPVLMDFGLTARTRGAIGREALAFAGVIRGTLSYLAPEIIEGQIPDNRADLYALGCMLWESLTGWPPFQAPTASELVGMHVNVPPGRLSAVVAGVPPALDDLVASLLAKRPSERLGHAEDVAESLAGIEGGAARQGRERRGEARSGFLFRPHLVGREAALGKLLACTAHARSGTGALALIGGESGIGKTFLASEVAQRASLEGTRIITGECVLVTAGERSSGERSAAPLHPFRHLLQALADQCRQLGPADAGRAFGMGPTLLAPYETALAEIADAAEWPQAVPLPAEAARERLLATFRQTLVAFVGATPLMLVLDDLQWADDLTLAFLASLGDSAFAAAPLVVLGIYRTDEANDELRRLIERPGVCRVELERLDDEQVATIVAQMLAVTPPPPALVQFVRRHAEGIPFFVAEYLRAATAHGLLTRQNGQWHVEPQGDGSTAAFGAIALPGSLAGLVRARLSRLGATATRAAEAAAVVGREFETWALAAVTRLDDAAVAEALVELVDRQVLEGAGLGRYRFLHDKIREEALAGIHPAVRRDLHLAVTRGLEARLRTHPHEHRDAELAYHFRAADQPRRALDYLARAGAFELRASAHGDAVRHFREALELEEQLPDRLSAIDRAALERQLGEALQGLGRLAESAEPLTRAAASLGLPLPRTKGRLAAGLVRELGRQVLHRLWPRLFRGRLAHRSALLIETGRVLGRLQDVFYYTGRDFELLFANLSMLNLCELAVASSELAMAYGGAAATAMMLSARKLSQSYFRSAFSTLEQAPDPVVESHLEMLLGLFHNVAGEREAAIRHSERAMHLAAQTGFARRRDEAASIRAGLDLVPGRHELAMVTILEMEASANRRGDAHMTSWALLQRVECLVLRGDFAEARTVLDRVLALLPGLGRPEAIWALGQLAYVRHRQGDTAEAQLHADHALALATKGPPVHAACAVTYARIAEVHLALWVDAPAATRRSAAKAAARACKVVSRSAATFPVMQPMAALLRGTHAWLTGKAKEAHRRWRQGVDRARALENRYVEARLGLALAATLPPESGERQAFVTSAFEVLSAMNIHELDRGGPIAALSGGVPSTADAGAGTRAQPAE